MTKPSPIVPLQMPHQLTDVSADVVTAGRPIPPIERIRIFSDREWEEFVLEWADSLRAVYEKAERCGGAGDMGRDIICTDRNDDKKWDNYQCKHYKDPLTPSAIWLELGKLVYYTFEGEYTYPRRYFFIAPQGAGTKLSKLLKDATKLKEQFLDQWDAHCRTGITSTKTIELTAPLRTYIQTLDFSIFDAIPPLRLIDQHSHTRWYSARFGGGLPARPAYAPPPSTVAPHEVNYIHELLGAYGEYLNCQINQVSDLKIHDDIRDHFDDSRLEFYSAEALRLFSRDILPPGEFEKLQDEVHFGIKDEVRGEHKDGYRRVMAVVKTARFLQITGHALHQRVSQRDRGGICHQLANDQKIKWTKK